MHDQYSKTSLDFCVLRIRQDVRSLTDLRDCRIALATETTIHSDMVNSEVVLKKSSPEDILSSLL